MNSFTITKEGNSFKSQSHNLIECCGYGATESDAIDDMKRKLVYVRDNDPVRWKTMIKKQVQELIAKGERPLLVYSGGRV